MPTILGVPFRWDGCNDTAAAGGIAAFMAHARQSMLTVTIPSFAITYKKHDSQECAKRDNEIK